MLAIPGYRVVAYRPEFGEELVRMWRASFERALATVDPNPIAKQLAYLEEQVVPANDVLVVRDAATLAIVAFLAARRDFVAQLYVHVDHQGKGIGSRLLQHAKEQSGGRLRLFTLDANRGAQRFYEARGFVIIGRGFDETGQNPDVEYEWVAES